MEKKILWMLLSDLNKEDIHLVLPTVAWIANDAGVEFECYLECERNGNLFARTGSTIIGGHHHQQFNYLNAVFDVKYIIYGRADVFRSSIDAFHAEIIADTTNIIELYETLIHKYLPLNNNKLLFACNLMAGSENSQIEIGPYLFPEIYYRKALALPAEVAGDSRLECIAARNGAEFIFLDKAQAEHVRMYYPNAVEVDDLKVEDDYGTVTIRIAERWKSHAKALAFADPAAILSQIPLLCRQERIAVYGEKISIPQKDVIYCEYTEAKTKIAAEVIRLANEIGDRVIIGRQTGDGDLFEWSKGGVCIQIMDPNRPAFPVVETVPHVWYSRSGTIFEEEPDNATLEKYADEGKILAALMVHSGEMAHNEAMLNFFELVSFTGLKMGLGVHAARYETCPQLWELLNVPKEKGGVKGYIEPVLHSGGMGVLAEINCPPDILKEHTKTALTRIKRLAGEGACPKGYYAFADTDLETLRTIKSDVFEAVEECGLEYFVSSARPGRNLILHQSEQIIAINQTSRTQCSGSPFVRITTIEDIHESAQLMAPGWFIGTVDAPVISFNPYIWRHGSRFMKIVDWLKNTNSVVNVTPHTVARYARILKKKGLV